MRTLTTITVMLVSAAVVATPLGTEFTYQGVLSDGGAPAAGAFDFRFFLYDADAGGSQVGAMVLVEDLVVADGRISTRLDFGSVFDGTALWLEVGVRDGASTGTYTVLSPRQELTAAPFAQHAATAVTADMATVAGHATTAGDADVLDGQDGSYYLSWSNFVGIPADIANGDDDTLADLGCGIDEIARWDGSAWNCSVDDDNPYVRTYVVGPVGGGAVFQNGAALLEAIGNIPVPVNSNLSVLVKLEPGVYDMGTDALALGSWMTIEGSGRGLTTVTSAFCGSAYQGTIFSNGVAHGIGLRHLTVENTCAEPSSRSVAFSNQGIGVSVEHAELRAKGAALDGSAMINSGGAVSLANTTLFVNNATGTTTGLSNTGIGIDLTDVIVSIANGATARGIHSRVGGHFNFRRGRVDVWSATSCEAVKIEDDENAFLSDVELNSSCPEEDNIGLLLNDSSAVVTNSWIRGRYAVDGTGIRVQTWGPAKDISLHNVNVFSNEVGLWCEDPGTNGTRVKITRSVLSAGTDAIQNGGLACAIQVGVTQLEGGVSGAATCAGVYDGSYTFYPNTCPP